MCNFNTSLCSNQPRQHLGSVGRPGSCELWQPLGRYGVRQFVILTDQGNFFSIKTYYNQCLPGKERDCARAPARTLIAERHQSFELSLMCFLSSKRHQITFTNVSL